MDVYEFVFPNEELAEKAEKEILTEVGRIVKRHGKAITIEAPPDSASEAAKIAERNGGQLGLGSLFQN